MKGNFAKNNNKESKKWVNTTHKNLDYHHLSCRWKIKERSPSRLFLYCTHIKIKWNWQNCKKTKSNVMSLLPWIGFQTVVPSGRSPINLSFANCSEILRVATFVARSFDSCRSSKWKTWSDDCWMTYLSDLGISVVLPFQLPRLKIPLPSLRLPHRIFSLFPWRHKHAW